MIALNQILVATDFSEPANAALTYGRELARRFGATLHVLHVIEDFGARFVEVPLYTVDLGRMQTDAEGRARVRLQSLLSEEDWQALHAKAVVLTSNSPSEAIISYARDAMPMIGCIVMGTHGRGGIARLWMGSVAERVVRSAPCPVLTVRHPEHEFVMPDAMVTTAHA